MRLVAVGDIHGQLQKLESLMAKVNPAQADRFVFLGDYIDRGPDSRGVVDFLIRFTGDFPQTIFLRGNHEQMALDVLAHELDEKARGQWFPSMDRDLWLVNGGREMLASYCVTKIEEIHKTHKDFLEETQIWYRQGGFLFVHAGAYEDRPLEIQTEIILWERFCPPGRKEIHVVGHTPCDENEPHFEEGRYNLDTGAAYGGKLTACDVLTRRVWQT